MNWLTISLLVLLSETVCGTATNTSACTGSDTRGIPEQWETAVLRTPVDLVTSANKYTGTVERVPVPSLVLDRFVSLAYSNYLSLNADREVELPPFSAYCRSIFLVPVPGGKQMYVCQFGLYHDGNYWFWVYDPATRRVSPQPENICAYWMNERDDLLSIPTVSFQDINGDGKPEIAFQEHLHYGTDADADLVHFYSVEDDLSLSEILAIKTHEFVPGCEIKRMIETITATSVTVKVEMFSTVADTDEDKGALFLKHVSRVDDVW